MDYEHSFSTSILHSPQYEIHNGFHYYEDGLLYPELETLPIPSAFHKYSYESRCHGTKYGSVNIHSRMLGLLRRMNSENTENKGNDDGRRGFQHMMRERQRREKLSQAYADLLYLLHPKSKADKNSIVISTTTQLKEVKKVMEEVQAFNAELKSIIMLRNRLRRENEEIIRIQVADPSSSIDSMIAALTCLKGMDTSINSIKFHVSTTKLSGAIHIQTKMETGEVERAVQGAAMAVKGKGQLWWKFPGTNQIGHHFQVENAL